MSPKIPAAKPTPILDRFYAQAGALAKQSGIQTLVMVAQDPQTGAITLVASPNAMEAVKDLVAAKFGLTDPDTDISWPGA